MHIYSAKQIKKWDKFTIQREKTTSLQLMEAAAEACLNYFFNKNLVSESFAIFCGPGNNGGDGLVIARMLQEHQSPVTVFLLSSKIGTREYEIQLKRYKETGGKVVFLRDDFNFEDEYDIIVDAILGIGLNKPVEGFYGKVIETINESDSRIFSIDIPSGMFADKSSIGNTVVKADVTLTFENKKRAFFLRENAENTGAVEVLKIGLSPDFYLEEPSQFWETGMIDGLFMQPVRSDFSHKGDFGHACIIAGSRGMMGAAILSAQGCLRSGVGKLTCYTCNSGYTIMQTSVPEAMCKTSGEDYITNIEGLENFDVIGVGPGIGQYDEHVQWLKQIFELNKPMVIDADALNVMSKHKELLGKIPANSILTPHPKEFERLFGKSKNEIEQQDLAMKMAVQYQITIVLKGHCTFIATPEDKGLYNSSGNAGMATGGSGDVLTGVLTGLLAQKLPPDNAATFGVFLHGLAGDLAAKDESIHAMKASDIHEYIGKAYLRLSDPAKLLDEEFGNPDYEEDEFYDEFDDEFGSDPFDFDEDQDDMDF